MSDKKPTEKRKRDSSSPSEAHPATRRKQEKSSDESHTTIFTDDSGIVLSSKATSKGEDNNMASNDNEDFSGYYAGLRGKPSLLSRSSEVPWVRPTGTGYWDDPLKHVCVIRNHPLKAKLDAGLRRSIRSTLDKLQPNHWISVDYVRIGYSDVESENPPVVWITVEKGEVSFSEAKTVAKEIKAECDLVGLLDVEVELIEGTREGQWGFNNDPLPLIAPTRYPLVGASLAAVGSKATGSLGGFLKIHDEVYALSNHHVLLGTQRQDSYPGPGENIGTIRAEQPSQADLDRAIDGFNYTIKNLKTHSGNELEISQKEEQVRSLEAWKGQRSSFGPVYKSSGISHKGDSQRRYDWALVKVERPDCSEDDADRYVNQIPIHRDGRYPAVRVFNAAIEEGGLENEGLDSIPRFMKRALSNVEIEVRKDAAEAEGKFVVWKHGRTTHTTWGTLSRIDSDYKSSSGQTSKEIAVADSHEAFSIKGDSGAWVWDTNGYVIGMLWGGTEEHSLTYVTAMEWVLGDIKSTLGTENVHIVVRKEEEDDVEFRPAASGFMQFADETPADGIPNLFDDEVTFPPDE